MWTVSLDPQLPFHGCRGAGFETSRQANCFSRELQSYNICPYLIKCGFLETIPFELSKHCSQEHLVMEGSTSHCRHLGRREHLMDGNVDVGHRHLSLSFAGQFDLCQFCCSPTDVQCSPSISRYCSNLA